MDKTISARIPCGVSSGNMGAAPAGLSDRPELRSPTDVAPSGVRIRGRDVDGEPSEAGIPAREAKEFDWGTNEKTKPGAAPSLVPRRLHRLQ